MTSIYAAQEAAMEIHARGFADLSDPRDFDAIVDNIRAFERYTHTLGRWAMGTPDAIVGLAYAIEPLPRNPPPRGDW